MPSRSQTTNIENAKLSHSQELCIQRISRLILAVSIVFRGRISQNKLEIEK